MNTLSVSETTTQENKKPTHIRVKPSTLDRLFAVGLKLQVLTNQKFRSEDDRIQAVLDAAEKALAA